MGSRTRTRTAADKGRDLYRSGKFAQAARKLQRWIDRNPSDADAHHDLAASFMAMGMLEEAETACTQATRAGPGSVMAWTSLATIQAARGQIGTPLKSMMMACRLKPNDPKLRSRLGIMLLDQNHLDQALRAFEAALSLDPSCLDALSGAAMVLERQGRLDEARAMLEPVVQTAVHARVGLVWGTVSRRLGQPEQACTVIQRILQTGRMSTEARMMMLYELGPSLERTGDSQAAWATIEEANRLQIGRFDPDALVAQTDQIIAAFSAEAMAALPRAQDTDRLPILIVGMPRSGTSLVEQVLSAHPDVAPAGELSDLQAASQLAGKLIGQPFPGCVADLTPAFADRLGDWYLSRRRTSHPDARRVTDKMPENFKHLGLAAALLPGATLIACERQPADIALSCFFQNFKAPLAWSYRLEWLAVYMAQHRRLMDHWAQVMPGRVHRVEYEALVADPETQSRALIAAAGLDWDPAVLSHHRSEHTVHTASYAQAKQPIYRSSVGRAEAYSEHLDPFFSAQEAPWLHA
jgi:Flp pilus assembly protein TadD